MTSCPYCRQNYDPNLPHFCSTTLSTTLLICPSCGQTYPQSLVHQCPQATAQTATLVTCTFCGQSYGLGTVHYCSFTLPQSSSYFQFVQPTPPQPPPKFDRAGLDPPETPGRADGVLVPHLCPVCSGKGQVGHDPGDPLVATRDRVSWPCRPCEGDGLLWS